MLSGLIELFILLFADDVTHLVDFAVHLVLLPGGNNTKWTAKSAKLSERLLCKDGYGSK